MSEATTKSSRTLLLCVLVVMGGWSLAWRGIDASLLLAWGTVAGSALAVWVGGKGWASYVEVLKGKNGGGE